MTWYDSLILVPHSQRYDTRISRQDERPDRLLAAFLVEDGLLRWGVVRGGQVGEQMTQIWLVMGTGRCAVPGSIAVASAVAGAVVTPASKRERVAGGQARRGLGTLHSVEQRRGRSKLPRFSESCWQGCWPSCGGTRTVGGWQAAAERVCSKRGLAGGPWHYWPIIGVFDAAAHDGFGRRLRLGGICELRAARHSLGAPQFLCLTRV